MVMSLLYHAISAWFAFLLPSYATFKALSHRPPSETELQRWSMYWVIVGVFVAFEYLAEWLICWLPFYWEIKTVFLLFLALPQTEGSTYIYTSYVQPFFVNNEAELDAGIISIQRNIFAFLQARLIALWEFVWSYINKAQVGRPVSGDRQSMQAPALSLDSVVAVWKTYSPFLAGASRNQPSVSSNSVNTPNVEFRNTENGQSQNSKPSTPSFSRSSPSFPDPQQK